MKNLQQLMFCVYDNKAEAYLNPFFLPMKAMAIREFQNCVNDENHAFGRNPADYTLFMIGVWDGDSGKVIDTDTSSLGNGVEFLQTQSETPHEIRNEAPIQQGAAG